jgi:putative resolvase
MQRPDWARQQGISDSTAWRWVRVAKLPVPARHSPPGTIPVEAPRPESTTVHSARVPSADPNENRERHVHRLQAVAHAQGGTAVNVVTDIGSGGNGHRTNLRRILRDPQVVRMVIEHRDRLARFGCAVPEAALAATGRHVVVRADGDVTDDPVHDVLDIRPSACGHRDGRRSARRRARQALEVMRCG